MKHRVEMGSTQAGPARRSAASVRPAAMLGVPAWLVATLGALLALRLAALAFNRTDLFFDEAQYWAWSLEPAFGYYSKPPLIAWLIAVATHVCGVGEACIRSPAPILHTATALAVFALGARLYGTVVGALSAVAFALLPGVSLSAGIISTDVPLLTCWALALFAFAALFDTRAWWPAALLGIAFGLGLNAKYAMAWFLLCGGIYLAVTPTRRAVLADARLWAGLALGVALILPNLVWNGANGFATFSHTADNAKWGGSLIHPDKAAEFFASQFGVFGPFYFAGLVLIAWRAVAAWWTQGEALPEADRLLLAFSLPLVAVITVQAFVSRAHPNWAAPAYVAASVLVIATLVRDAQRGWLAASFWLHGAICAGLVAATATAGLFAMPGGVDPFWRTLGWHGLADAVKAEIAAGKARGITYRSVLTEDRAVTAELLYYLRDAGIPVLAWKPEARPHDHFEMTRPFTGADAQQPALLVRVKEKAGGTEPKEKGRPVLPSFAQVAQAGSRDVPAGPSARRTVTFITLSGYIAQ